MVEIIEPPTFEHFDSAIPIFPNILLTHCLHLMDISDLFDFLRELSLLFLLSDQMKITNSPPMQLESCAVGLQNLGLRTLQTFQSRFS